MRRNNRIVLGMAALLFVVVILMKLFQYESLTSILIRSNASEPPAPIPTRLATPIPIRLATPMLKSRNALEPTTPIVICGNASDLIDLGLITPPGRPKVDVFINIPVAGQWSIRREVIRNSWLSTVKNYSIAYRFFTDSIGIKPTVMKDLLKEQDKFKDLEFLPTKQGYWLTHRYLFAMFWGYEHYDFKFYMKIDDDYFVCLNNLANDIRYRMHERLLYWGWFECDHKMVAMDEGFLIISLDLVQEIIRRNNSLCCHPFGGQMIAMWVNRLEHEGYDVTYFPDNNRLMHIRNDFKSPSRDMCRNLLGVHQAYPKYMKHYWNLTKDTWFSIKEDEFEKVERKKYEAYCNKPRGWDWRVLGSFYKKEPKPCWEPGLRWPSLEKYEAVRSRELEE